MKRKSKRRIKKLYQYLGGFIAVIFGVYLGGYIISPDAMDELYKEFINSEEVLYSINPDKVPKDDGNAYIVVNNNNPEFSNELLSAKKSYESYSELDDLGRCGEAIALIGKDIMPTEERGNIGSIYPSGWHTIKYNNIEGNYLYNRCHLIGYQLTGENKNPKNLITCTRETNVGVMLDYENKIAEYVKRTNNHVLYRVTPYFKGTDLLASGIKLEAYSLEDNGSGIKFNIYIFNKQKGIEINYSDGSSKLKVE